MKEVRLGEVVRAEDGGDSPPSSIFCEAHIFAKRAAIAAQFSGSGCLTLAAGAMPSRFSRAVLFATLCC